MITKIKHNNWLNEDEKEQASKLGLLLKSRQTNRNSSFTQAPQSPTLRTIQVT